MCANAFGKYSWGNSSATLNKEKLQLQWNWLFQSSNQDKKDHGLQQCSSGNQGEALIARLCENSPSSFSKSNNKKPALATQSFILVLEQLQMSGA